MELLDSVPHLLTFCLQFLDTCFMLWGSPEIHSLICCRIFVLCKSAVMYYVHVGRTFLFVYYVCATKVVSRIWTMGGLKFTITMKEKNSGWLCAPWLCLEVTSKAFDNLAFHENWHFSSQRESASLLYKNQYHSMTFCQWITCPNLTPSF